MATTAKKIAPTATTKKAPVKAAPAAVKKAPVKAAPTAVKKTAASAAPAKKGFPARKPGAAPARARKPLPSVKAPADFKPHFLLVEFKTEKDGLIGAQLKATRYQGKFDFDADDKKKFPMAAYDLQTVVGIAARLAGVTYKATNDKKLPVVPKERDGFKGAARLPASTVFSVLMRVGKKAADNTLTAGVKQVFQTVTSAKTGRVSRVDLLKTDPAYRMIRKASRTLPQAFANVQMPPKRTRGSRKEVDDGEE
jgi:hypothetical protein